MKNDKSQFVVRTSDSYLLSSIVIGHLTHRRHYLGGREKKCIAGFQPAKVVLTQKELSRLRCRRDAGATIFSHDLCLRGETGRLAAPGSLSESQSRRHGENRSRRSRTANIFNLQLSVRRPLLKGRSVSVYI